MFSLSPRLRVSASPRLRVSGSPLPHGRANKPTLEITRNALLFLTPFGMARWVCHPKRDEAPVLVRFVTIAAQIPHLRFGMTSATPNDKLGMTSAARDNR